MRNEDLQSTTWTRPAISVLIAYGAKMKRDRGGNDEKKGASTSAHRHPVYVRRSARRGTGHAEGRRPATRRLGHQCDGTWRPQRGLQEARAGRADPLYAGWCGI